MGFYGRKYEHSVNDYFNTVLFKRAHTDDNGADNFPNTEEILQSNVYHATAVVPAQDLQIATGNQWIQFVVNHDNADINSQNNNVAYGITMFHKKADGVIANKLINFTNATLKDSENKDRIEEGAILLGYGKSFDVGDITFDKAGHAAGSKTGVVTYKMPRVLNKDTYNTAYTLQKEIETNINRFEKEQSLNTLLEDCPFSASAIIRPLVVNTEGLIEVNTTVYGEGKEKTGGLVGQVNSLSTKTNDLDSQIQNTILPALNLTPGIGKPGIEFSDAKQLYYKSFVSDDKEIKVGSHGTILGRYSLNSLRTPKKVEFTAEKPYVPNVYYIINENGDYIISTAAKADDAIDYYTMEYGNILKDTNYALGKYSIAEGYATRAIGDYSHAENGFIDEYNNMLPAVAYGRGSHAEGKSATTIGPHPFKSTASLADGIFPDEAGFSIDSGRRSKYVCVGLNVNIQDAQTGQSVPQYSVYPATVENGTLTISQEYLKGLSPIGTHYDFYTNIAFGDSSHVEGAGSMAQGDYSHAEGYINIAVGTASHAEGNSAHAIGNYSHAEGNLTNAEKESAHAEGNKTEAKGKYSHAEGQSTIARGDASHSEGDTSEAVGKSSHAEGGPDGIEHTVAKGDYSHAEGQATTAEGVASHSEGQHTQARGDASHASGIHTIAMRNGAAVFGQYNKDYSNDKDNAPIFAIGIGTGTGKDQRKDAFSVDILGNSTFTGSCNIAEINSSSGMQINASNGLQLNRKVPDGTTRVYGTFILESADGKWYHLKIENGSLKLVEVHADSKEPISN